MIADTADEKASLADPMSRRAAMRSSCDAERISLACVAPANTIGTSDEHSHASQQGQRFLTVPFRRSGRKSIGDHENRAPNGARFISRCLEPRVKAGDGARLLDVERLPRGPTGRAVDQENATSPIA
jgi:hypothetical protein